MHLHNEKKTYQTFIKNIESGSTHILITTMLFISIFALIPQAKSKTTQNSTASIENVLGKQAEAWNKGDLDSFMTGYLKSDKTSYTSGGTEVWGYDALQARYQKKYGSDKEHMGQLKFSDLKVQELGPNYALTIGHWHLEQKSQAPVDGVFSLILNKTKDGWKVIHDHTSVKKEAS